MTLSKFIGHKTFLFHKYLDENESLKFIGLIAFVTLFIFSIFTEFVYLLIPCACIMMWLALSRINYIGGEFKFDKSRYNLPLVGTLFVVNKELRDFICNNYHYSDGNRIELSLNENLKLVDISFAPSGKDWNLTLEFPNGRSLGTKYIPIRKMLKTRLETRDELLKKIGIV